MGRYALARDLGCAMALRAPSVAVMKILSLAGMERMIKIEKDGGKNEDQ
jgi:anti-anti-sigma regulatory factor